MKESENLLGNAEPSDICSQWRSLIREKEYKLTITLVFFSAVVLNFSWTLLSIFYIKIWDVHDELAGIFLALNCTQVLFLFAPGILIDRYGIKKTYYISTITAIISMTFVIFIQNLYFQLIILNVSFGFTSTVLYAALKAGITESTSEDNRSLGFSIFNASMSFSTILLGIIFELVFFFNGINVTSYKIIFIVLIACFLFNIGLIAKFSDLHNQASSSQKIRVMEIIQEKRYWKTLAVIFFSAIPMAGVFSPGIVLPIYMDRELGSTFGYGLFFAVFSLLTGIFSVLFDFLTNYLSLYNCIILGSCITSVAPLVFMTYNNYLIIFSYIVITAVGAAILESRIFDYNSFASVKGQEGFYYGLASFGYAITAISTGFFSGFMLERYCPEDGERECWKMWLGLCLTCAGGTLILVILKPFIEVPEDNQARLSENKNFLYDN